MSDTDLPERTEQPVHPEPLAPLERIRVGVEAQSWREAVRAAGQLLVDTGCATAEYPAAMETAVVDLGPYIVIAPGVAMPHARPESGATRAGVAVVTLDRPVEFGHAANDPVSVVIAFAALDKDAHISVMQSIVRLVGDEAALTGLRAATTDAEAAAAIGA